MAIPHIEPGSPWENGYCESFNSKLRDECLNQEIFYSLKEAQIIIEQWRNQYNTVRPPHRSDIDRLIARISTAAHQTSTGQMHNLDRHAPLQ
ncbi:hypothetical protein NWI01_33880 [Nitrobacter winogradskyi]|uniref:Integrase catalytic domain-containing protein n=1 Tax=Nitrobacter winogradskyi TaxID=913 RepID=A0A4Y3WJG4_NITWI|nr:hypothetical protein NWI01_33880 [Nitrobacter winogradskyi]